MYTITRRYVLFDWDTHFAAYMLSLDARELGYSVLIQATWLGLGLGLGLELGYSILIQVNP